MAEGVGAVGGAGSNFVLSAKLELQDQMSGKLRNAASQLKSIDSAVSKLGNRGEVARLAKQFDSLNDLRKQVDQFKQLKRSVSATQQAYNQANASTAQLARQYKDGQSAVSQLKAKHDELKSTFDKSQAATTQLKSKLGDLKSEVQKIKSSGATEQYQKLQNQIKATSAELKASQTMTRSTGAELKSLANGVKQAQGELNNIGKAFEQSKAKAAQLKRELKTQQPALSQMRQNLAAQGFNTKNFVQSEIQLRRQMESAAQKLRIEQKQQHLKDAMAQAGMGQNQIKPIQVNVSGNANSQLGKIKKELQTLTGKAWNVAVNAKNAISGKANELMNGAAMGMGGQVMGIAGLGYGIADAVNTYKEFEYQMATVKAITGANADEFAVLTKRAKELGATTMFKASEVGKAEEYMGMAGWKTPQIEAGLPAVLNLAAASGEELARVSDIVTDSMTAFGLKATDVVTTADGKIVKATDHFADVFAALATNANTTVSMAGETSKYSAAVVGSLYASQSVDDKMRAVEDWAAITGIMANAGIKGSMSGTAQRSMLTRLAAMQTNANAARESLGVDFTYQQDEVDAQGNVHKAGQTRRLRDVLGDMRSRFQGDFDPEQLLDMTERLEGKEFSKQQRIKLSNMIEDVKAKGGMSDADKATITSMLSGQEGMAAWLSVLMASNEDWEHMADAIDKAHGKADEMSKVKMDTLEGDVKTLGSAFEALQLEIFSGNGGDGLRGFTQALTDDIRFIQEALKDGFDIGDIGGLLAQVATQLKDKFLQFDGVGSILAGGALVMGLKKIYDLTMKVKDAAMTAKSWWQGAAQSTHQSGGLQTRPNVGSIAQSVGTMNVKAGVVNINGKVSNAPAGQQRGNAPATTNSRTTTPRPTSAPSTLSRFGGVAKMAGGAAALTGVFALMDLFSTRSTNEGRINEATAQREQYQKEYQEIVADPTRHQELPQATQNLNQASADLRAIQKEAAQHNNESLFGGLGAMGGAATGAALGSVIPGIGTIAGLIIGGVLAAGGAELGKEFGKNFETDILGKFFGSDKSNQMVDFKLDNGKMLSELSYSDQAVALQHLSAAELGRMNEETKKQQFAAEFAAAAPNLKSSNLHNRDKSREEIDAQIKRDEETKAAAAAKAAPKTGEEVLKQTAEERKDLTADQIRQVEQANERRGLTKEGLTPAQLEEMNKQRALAASEKARLEGAQKWEERFQSVGDFFKNLFGGEVAEAANGETNLGAKQEDAKSIQEANQLGTDFWSSIKDSVVSAFTPQEVESGGDQRDHLGFEMPDSSQMWSDFNVSDFLPDIDISQWLTESTAGMELPDLSQMWTEFNVSDFLPELNISEWLSESMMNFEMPDISAMLPDLSSIGTTLSESFAGIPETISNIATSVGEGFSQIPTAASEAFSTISTAASEGWTAIQTEWSQLPSFFDGLWAGAGSAASAAGSAIASGINSAIGTIQSAWEGLSSWLSSKISSLASMASSYGCY